MKPKRISSAGPNAYTLLKTDLRRLFREPLFLGLLGAEAVGAIVTFFLRSPTDLSFYRLRFFPLFLLTLVCVWVYSVVRAALLPKTAELKRKLSQGFAPGTVFAVKLTEIAFADLLFYIVGSLWSLSFCLRFPAQTPVYLLSFFLGGLAVVVSGVGLAALCAVIGRPTAAVLISLALVAVFTASGIRLSYRIDNSYEKEIWGEIVYTDGQTGPTAGFVPNPAYLEDAKREKLLLLLKLNPATDVNGAETLFVSEIAGELLNVPLLQRTHFLPIDYLSHQTIVYRDPDAKNGNYTPSMPPRVFKDLFPAASISEVFVLSLVCCPVFIRRHVGKKRKPAVG